MNRRALILGTAAVGAAALGGGYLLVSRQRAAELAAAQDKANAEGPGFDTSILVRPNSPVLGPADAKVTLVEFFDPSCEACRYFHPILKRLRGTFQTELRIVMRYTMFHQGSDEAVRILETARIQNMFEPILNALIERQPEWAKDGAPDLDLAWQIAGENGLDLTKAKVDSALPDIVAIINQDNADVKAAGVRATPTFFVNGKQLLEADEKALYAAVRRELGQS
ncbi:MAG: DsbA family protein [Proteobacteria bacterium]|nr:DsbA family protein [Pseudomonadota bacterium]